MEVAESTMAERAEVCGERDGSGWPFGRQGSVTLPHMSRDASLQSTWIPGQQLEEKNG